MTDEAIDNTSVTTWFVGASYGGTNDQMPRFLSDGIWENGYKDKYQEEVLSMRPGDRIAIKSSYTRKHNLPFDSHGQTVSVMAIKATGIIIENLNDGRRVRVDWTIVEPPREWYFYTNRGTVWRVHPGEWMADDLIAFTFDNKPQNIDSFVNAPKWKERYGSIKTDERFEWTKFYQAFADKLLPYRNNRAALVEAIHEISKRVDGLNNLDQDRYKDGTTGFVRDICPFTTMGLFNRGLRDSNRTIIATELAKFLGVKESTPKNFDGIPLLNLQNTWLFRFEDRRKPRHIDALWEVFQSAINFADSPDDNTRMAFAEAYNNAVEYKNVGWKLTLGLYWIRPWNFLTLDSPSRNYIRKKLNIEIGLNGPLKRCSALDYLAAMDTLETRFMEENYPVHSYPELSLEAWLYKDTPDSSLSDGNKVGKDHNGIEFENEHEIGDVADEGEYDARPIVPYNVDEILKDGCFLEREEIDRLLERLRNKKNIILQGPPGTGKTWLAKRLAFALMGEKDESKVRAVQFHPNLSYEDFVRGWRPTGEGKLSLADGVFMESIKAALKNPSSQFVIVIEEINRGNPAQIFGELLTLLETDKRSPSDALELCYPDADGKRHPVHIPENLYVIGTMNIADRSLALVDLALRRRFAFVGLEPKIGDKWRKWVVEECGVDKALVADIEQRITKLNDQIAADTRLGKQFRIGHSYVTPAHRLEDGVTKKWFLQVIDTEIAPLLEEYWFDEPNEAQKACEVLIQGWQ